MAELTSVLLPHHTATHLSCPPCAWLSPVRMQVHLLAFQLAWTRVNHNKPGQVMLWAALTPSF